MDLRFRERCAGSRAAGELAYGLDAIEQPRGGTGTQFGPRAADREVVRFARIAPGALSRHGERINPSGPLEQDRAWPGRPLAEVHFGTRARGQTRGKLSTRKAVLVRNRLCDSYLDASEREPAGAVTRLLRLGQNDWLSCHYR
jgi:hypothetical protein